MLFNSSSFLLLAVITLTLYYMPLLRHWQPYVLILASFVFYAFEQPVLLTLLIASIAINVVTSYYVVQTSGRWPRFWATIGVALNLGVLLFFKYSPLFATTLFHSTEQEGSLGHFLVTLPLPIGISFFTFQGISLLVETYQGKHDQPGSSTTPPSGLVAGTFIEHLRNTALFKSFFPVLVAGPIVRAHEFYPQIKPKFFRDIPWTAAFRALVLGYFLKMVVADNLKDFTFLLSYPGFLQESSSVLLSLVLGYSMQIFADFAGYSLIAIGLGHLLGYSLPVNFNAPYIARSFSEFWRRWHISLSTWLRDFLYLPLGGNRRGKVRTYLNLFIVMFLGGLWHGAAWSYAVWGTFHGVALAAERACKGRVSLPSSRYFDLLRIGAVFAGVTIAWLFFKLPSIDHVVAFFKALFTSRAHTQDEVIAAIVVFSMPVVLLHGWHLLKTHPSIQNVARHDYLVFGGMLFAIVLNSGTAGRFIYFQF